MKVINFLLGLILFFLSNILLAQEENPNYNPELAKEQNADDYGMKMYTLVLLSTGDNKDESEAKSKAFAAHMQNINTIADEGKLVVAGPFGLNEKGLRGLFILNTTDIDEAKVMLEADLAIQQGFLKAEYITYYGSAALPLYLDKHDTIWKIKP